MVLDTALTRLLGISNPLILAPMGGGPTTTDLVVAVCEAGGLGFLAGAYLTPLEIAEQAAQIRGRTSRPFGINLFAPVPSPGLPAAIAAALELLDPIHAELGIAPPVAPVLPAYTFEEQLQAVLDSNADVFSFTFGIPFANDLARMRARRKLVFGTATTVREAVLLEQAGVDAVVAQGSEAGAHRGTFAVSFSAGMVGSIALLPQVVDALSVPVIASGGIMDGRGLAAALVLGAQAAQMGTAFLACDEAGTSRPYREALRTAREDETRTTTAFSGRPARGIGNAFMDAADANPDAILPYPWQNALTRPMRTAAAAAGNARYLSLWAGQGLPLARSEPAAEIVARVIAEAAALLTAGWARPS